MTMLGSFKQILEQTEQIVCTNIGRSKHNGFDVIIPPRTKMRSNISAGDLNRKEQWPVVVVRKSYKWMVKGKAGFSMKMM